MKEKKSDKLKKYGEICSNSFNGLTNLRELDLSNNIGVYKIKANTFKGLSQLEELKLTYRQIENIDFNAFKCLPKLRILGFIDCSYNICNHIQ